MAPQNSEQDLEYNQLRKMRRRIEEFLRHCKPEILVQIALICKIQVPKKLIVKYCESNEE